MSKHELDAAYVAAMKQHIAQIRHEVALRMRRRHESLARRFLRLADERPSRDVECDTSCSHLPPASRCPGSDISPDTPSTRRPSFSSLAWLVTIVFLMSLVRDASADSRRGFDDDDDDHDVELDIDVDVGIARRDGRRSRDGRDAVGDADDAIDVAAGASPIFSMRAPPIAEVVEAAYVAAGLDRDPTKSWSRRARAAALIPWVSLRAGWDASWREDDADVGRSRDFEVRATWRLDRLVFDGRELQVSSIDMARRRERRRLATRVIRAYFTWRKLSAAAGHEPRAALAAEAALAELDALTDGWFSERAKSPR